MYTVRQVAALTGVTPRTLHHYDSIGLLKPNRAPNGYRSYDEENLLRLQQILFYRELGLELDRIRSLMGSPDFSVVAALKAHKRALGRRMERLQRLLETVDQTLEHYQGGKKMSVNELFRDLTPQEQKAYADEAEERWDPLVVKESNRRYNALSEAEKRAQKEEMNSLYNEWSLLVGTDPAGPSAQALVERWRRGIEFFWSPDAVSLLGLAQLYNTDPRFKKNYDQFAPGLASFILECVEEYQR